MAGNLDKKLIKSIQRIGQNYDIKKIVLFKLHNFYNALVKLKEGIAKNDKANEQIKTRLEEV
jgi:hypothetical protein